MKVKELLKDLSFANPEARVSFATETGNLNILSIYGSNGNTVDKNNVTLSDVNKKSKVVYIDLA